VVTVSHWKKEQRAVLVVLQVQNFRPAFCAVDAVLSTGVKWQSHVKSPLLSGATAFCAYHLIRLFVRTTLEILTECCEYDRLAGTAALADVFLATEGSSAHSKNPQRSEAVLCFEHERYFRPRFCACASAAGKPQSQNTPEDAIGSGSLLELAKYGGTVDGPGSGGSNTSGRSQTSSK